MSMMNAEKREYMIGEVFRGAQLTACLRLSLSTQYIRN